MTRYATFLALLICILLPSIAHANTPLLTPKPKKPSQAACREWAAKQDDDAIEMWGTQEDGTSSRISALDRLARSCMGQRPPEIIGFGSSAGFDDEYCKRHPKFKLCQEHK